MGDAISLLPVLNSLRYQHAGLRIEVATTAGPAEVFNLATCVNKVVGYPLAVADWENYDHYLCLELVHETGQTPGRPLPEVFAKALGVELTHKSIELKLPLNNAVDRGAIAAQRLKCGLVVILHEMRVADRVRAQDGRELTLGLGHTFSLPDAI